jgi:hypothetical protein
MVFCILLIINKNKHKREAMELKYIYLNFYLLLVCLVALCWFKKLLLQLLVLLVKLINGFDFVMKQIKINKITFPVPGSHLIKNKSYTVNLGNGFAGAFASEKKALAFLAQTNKFLNEKFVELNFLYADFLRFARCNWLYFDTAVFTSYCSNIERCFSLMATKSGFTNGNYFVFSQFKVIVRELIAVCKQFEALLLGRGITAGAYEVRSFAKRANYIFICVFNYPKELFLPTEF